MLQTCSTGPRRPLLPQRDCATPIEADDVKPVLADIDTDHGDHTVLLLRHGVLLSLGASCQPTAGRAQEHGRTIPLVDMAPEGEGARTEKLGRMLGSGIVMHGQMRKGVAAGHLEALAHRLPEAHREFGFGQWPARPRRRSSPVAYSALHAGPVILERGGSPGGRKRSRTAPATARRPPSFARAVSSWFPCPHEQ